MDTDLEIVSYDRVGPVHFGMSAAMVEAALGPAEKRRKSQYRSQEVIESRLGSALKLVVGDAGVVEVTLFPPIAGARYGDCHLFQAPARQVLAHLCARDGEPRESVGVVVLLNLGISLGGFQLDDEPNQRSVTAVAHRRFDKYASRLTPFKSPAG